LNRSEIEAEVKKLGPWFHNMNRGRLETAPCHFLGDCPRLKCLPFEDAIPKDPRGKTVLDNADDRKALVQFLLSVDADTDPINP